MTGLAAPVPRARDTDRAREIQRVAADLFFARGFEATTTRQIAQALKMNSASLYYHYPDKEQILFDMDQAAEESGGVINAVLLGALAGSGKLPIPASMSSSRCSRWHGCLTMRHGPVSCLRRRRSPYASVSANR